MDNVLEEEALMQNVTREENLKAGWWPWPSDPTLIQGDGDGTVNIRSLKVRRSGCREGAVTGCDESSPLSALATRLNTPLFM